MKIAIFGLGYVGLTAAGCLSHEGHAIFGVDTNAEKVAQLKAGRTPISEPGLSEMLATARRNGLFDAETNLNGGLNGCDMAIVCVGTPSGPDGSHDMSHIAQVTRQIATAVKADRVDPLTVVYRSTFRPGTIENLIAPIFREVLGSNAGLVELIYNPEFLRESIAIQDFFSPPKIVIGTADGLPSARMDLLNAGLDARVFYTGFREAEFTKFADNAFHAVKVAFANELGRVCLRMGVSARKMHEIFVSDTKLNISPYYLRPGGAFGGSCLPKDVRALSHMSRDAETDTLLIDSLISSNEAHKRFLRDYCIEGLAPGSKILMLGLTFKPDSDDLRESPNVDLARHILQAGHDLKIYDPFIDPSALIGANLNYATTHLPNLAELLVTKAVAEAGGFARVIDNTGRRGALALGDTDIVEIHALP